MNTTRKLLIAANLKMNRLPDGALDDDSPYREKGNVDVIAIPTLLDIQQCLDAQIITGAQVGQCHNETTGAHTGDISMQMLADVGVRYVLCGHSERREFHGETDEDVAAQAIAALDANIHPIVCIGESSEEREAKKHEEVIERQVRALPIESDITIAYEPIWAIGENALRAATSEEAQEMHAFIRSLLSAERGAITRILYGGSLKKKNAKELLSQKDIDGGLIGGASLNLEEEFAEIVKIAQELSQE
ncbi:triose-phosphate isomerase [Patescibacteria group bacterium]|nr:triose-phosphate isomerase [Patescibacteria group bacterium]MBU2259047.1 triose-phosphate isomerase [Patescibacteria group bacterium]